jgi:peroxin-5
MSFLGGPECSTAANPLAQFQKQTGADTSLQRDRLTNRQPQHLNGFRSQQGLPEDAAFQDFAQQGPQFGEQLPNDAFHMDQLRREAENIQHAQGNGWAGEFAQPGLPNYAAAEQVQFKSGMASSSFSPQDFAQFRQGSMSPAQRTGSPAFQQQSAYRSPMYNSSFSGGYGMQRPMFQGGGFQPQQPVEVQGKGKGRVQELSDTDWEKQFEELSSQKEDNMEALDREAEAAIEAELNGIDR